MNGVIPTTRSTRPKRAESAAQIRSQARESSKPQVRQRPATDEMVGKGRSSTRRVIARRLLGERLGVDSIEALEDLDVDAAGEHLALGPDYQRPQPSGLRLVERRHQLLPHALPKEVERRGIDDDRAHVARVLEADPLSH